LEKKNGEEQRPEREAIKRRADGAQEFPNSLPLLSCLSGISAHRQIPIFLISLSRLVPIELGSRPSIADPSFCQCQPSKSPPSLSRPHVAVSDAESRDVEVI
jgi:hypothetical protein